MAGTPQGTPPDIREEMDMSWELTGPAINTTPPSQFLQNIYNPLAADDNHPTLQPAESFANDAAIAYGVADYNTQGRYLRQTRGRLSSIGAIQRNVAQNNSTRDNHRRSRASYDTFIATSYLGPRGNALRAPRANTNAQFRNATGLSPLSRDLLRPHRGYPRLPPRQRPGTITTPIRHLPDDSRRYIHGFYQRRQRLNVNAPSFRIVAHNNLHTSPLLQSIQSESLARSQSPRQDRAVPSPKRKLIYEPSSDGRSEDKLFHGENYYSTIRAIQTTEEAKRRLVSPKEEENMSVLSRKSSTKWSPSSIYSIFYQNLTRAPGHRPVTPVTPAKFRGNGRSMPGAWPESPATPLRLDTSTSSTSLITPPSTPDMSRMPGAWPKSPEPLPFTTLFPTIGTAAVTPPESPVDGSPSVNMDDVPITIPEPSVTEHLYESTSVPQGSPEIVWPEGPKEYQHRNFDQMTKDTILLLEEIQNTEQRKVRRAPRVNFPDNPVTRVKRYAKGEPISYPSPASTVGSHDETSLLGLSPSLQIHRELMESASSSSPVSSPSSDDGSSPPSMGPSTASEHSAVLTDYSHSPIEDSASSSSSDDGSSPPSMGPDTASEHCPVSPDQSHPFIEESLVSIEDSHTSMEDSLVPIEHSVTPTEQPHTPTRIPSAPLEVPFTPINSTDAASAQLAQEMECFVLRSDRRNAHRAVEREEAERTRQAQAAEHAAEQARQAEAEEARQKAESDARKKIEENEECKKTGRRRLPIENVLEPLTAEWEAKLLDILGKRPNEVVAMTSAGNELDRRDIGKVLPQPGTTDDPSGWLNDNVINGYLDSVVDYGLKARGHRRGETPKLHAFNSAFYKNITERGVESVKRWSRRPKISGKDLLKVEHVFIPVNVGGAHWTLLVVSPAWKRIEYFDSLHGSSGAAVRNAKAWIKMELGDAWNEQEWEVVEDSGLRGRGKGPRQSNSSDCGVFTITTAKMISLGVDPMAITAGDMPLQRKRVVVELVNGGFHGEFEPHVVF